MVSNIASSTERAKAVTRVNERCRNLRPYAELLVQGLDSRATPRYAEMLHAENIPRERCPLVWWRARSPYDRS